MKMSSQYTRCLLMAVMCLPLPRLAIAEDAAGTPSPRAVEAMRLLDSEDLYQRQLGFLRLEALREPATVERISQYLAHKDPEVRAYSLRAVAAIQAIHAVPTLLNALKDKQPRVRRAAIQGLEPLAEASPDVLPAFIRSLKDRDPRVRMAAIDALSRAETPRAYEAILQHRRRERNRDVKRVLTVTIKRLGL